MLILVVSTQNAPPLIIKNEIHHVKLTHSLFLFVKWKDLWQAKEQVKIKYTVVQQNQMGELGELVIVISSLIF